MPNVSEAARGTRAGSESSAMPLSRAPTPKARPLGLESSKARDETIGLWELEDERKLERIAGFNLREATVKGSIAWKHKQASIQSIPRVKVWLFKPVELQTRHHS